jgi:glycosyltransferase involved in cell wall biosynthesis
LSQRAALDSVVRALSEIQPELVHGHSSHGGLAARLAARRLRLPSVYTAHGWPFQSGAAFAQRALSFAGEFVGGHIGGAVIVLTDAEYERAKRAHVVPERRLWIVPNGIADVPPDMRRRGQATRAPVLVMVARFAPPKLQAELLAALGRLVHMSWTMRFVGDGPQLHSCRELLAANTELDRRVELLGHRDDVAELLAASDIGVLWSRYEGLPISVLEYMRAGLCCVTSDLPGARALFGDPVAGLLATDPVALTQHLAELLARPELVDDFGRRARARYESAYSVDAMVEATSAVYRSLVGG